MKALACKGKNRPQHPLALFGKFRSEYQQQMYKAFDRVDRTFLSTDQPTLF